MGEHLAPPQLAPLPSRYLRQSRAGFCLSRGELAEGAMRPGRVVMHQKLGQHPAQVLLIDDQQRSMSSRRRVPTTRSQIAFALDACGGLATIRPGPIIEPHTFHGRFVHVRHISVPGRWCPGAGAPPAGHVDSQKNPRLRAMPRAS